MKQIRQETLRFPKHTADQFENCMVQNKIKLSTKIKYYETIESPPETRLTF